jgi:hypothetical protein
MRTYCNADKEERQDERKRFGRAVIRETDQPDQKNLLTQTEKAHAK